MFTLSCDLEGVLSLRSDGRALPVSEAYLWNLCDQRGMRPEPGDDRSVGFDFVTDAVEEALAWISHEIATAFATKRHLLSIIVATRKAA